MQYVWLSAIVMASALAGCAGDRPRVSDAAAAGLTYEKPDVSAAQREHDEGECAKLAVADPGPQIGVPLPYSFDRDVFAACMRERGYVVRETS